MIADGKKHFRNIAPVAGWRMATLSILAASVCVCTRGAAADISTHAAGTAGWFDDVTVDVLPVKFREAKLGSIDSELGDLDGDGDGDLDMVVANVVIILTGQGRQNRLLINDGNGRFSDQSVRADGTAWRLPVDRASTRATILADLDGDGDLDIVCANRVDGAAWNEGSDGPANKFWVNDGNGFFRDESWRLPDDTANARDVAYGDIDGDGDLDIFVSNRNETSRVLFNRSLTVPLGVR